MKKAIWLLAIVLVFSCTVTVLAATRAERKDELSVQVEEPANSSTETEELPAEQVEPLVESMQPPIPKEAPVELYDNEQMFVAGDYVVERSRPSTDSDAMDARRIGDQVAVVAKRYGWYELANGNYIRAEFLAPDYPGIVSRYLQSYEDLVVVYISDQNVEYWHEDEMLKNGPCVSGDLNSSPTPIGFFVIGYKQTDFNMNDNPNTPVQYASFFNGGIAFHDASWRSEFGGDIYTWGGSHGCINLPLDMAEFIYNHSRSDYTHVLVLP